MPLTPAGYIIRLATEADFQEILEHFRQSFFKTAPLSKYFQLVTEENPICEDLENSVKLRLHTNIARNTVAVAVCSGKIVGVSLNSIQEKNQGVKSSKIEMKDDRVKVITEFLMHCFKESKLFEKYPNSEKIFLMDYISVDPAYTKRGIGKALIYNNKKLAKNIGCDLLIAFSTSHYSARVFETLHYELVFTQIFEEYVVKGEYNISGEYKVNGKIVLKPQEPHKALMVYAQKI